MEGVKLRNFCYAFDFASAAVLLCLWGKDISVY